MKVYVAGKWEDRSHIKEVMNKLIELGNQITVDWTNHEFGADGVIGDHEDFAIEDLEGVKNCDALVAIADKDFAFKGMYCEIGAALALDKLVFVVGKYANSCIFINHPLVEKCMDVEELYEYINEIYYIRKVLCK